MTKSKNQSVDAAEIAKFEAMATEWWDPNGVFRPLHHLNPCRLDYINAQIGVEFERDLSMRKPYHGIRILDIGCGGGLLCEPMARLGAEIVGVDASPRNIAVAQTHARQSSLEIDYRMSTAEALAAGGEKFDVILNMEVIEHVATPKTYIASCAELLRPGAIMVLSTLNRSAKSFALAIVGAEYVLRWLPRGTHEWRKFITPNELGALLAQAGLEHLDSSGMVLNPLRWEWELRPHDLAVNYVTTSRKI